MRFRAFRYMLPVTTYIGAFFSFNYKGWICFIPLILTWIIIPGVELFLKPGFLNLSKADEEKAKYTRTYDYILYLMVLLQIPTLFLFLYSMQEQSLSWIDKIGRIGTMGLFCGTCGINVGHELGHRVNKFDQTLAKVSLLSSLYLHNMIEHNKGHHKNVGTRNDASTARYGEDLYSFWVRCTVYTYINAWRIANREISKTTRTIWNIKNEMVQIHLLHTAFVGLIWLLFGSQGTIYFLIAAMIGILLLQTVGYIEHYGLKRKIIAPGKYERVSPMHSWDSDHLLGRLFLFEVSRHSDHHYMASRKYQILRHHGNSPQLPTGYPGMIMISLIPPVWFYLMNRRLKNYGIS